MTTKLSKAGQMSVVGNFVTNDLIYFNTDLEDGDYILVAVKVGREMVEYRKPSENTITVKVVEGKTYLELGLGDTNE